VAELVDARDLKSLDL